MSLFGTSPHHQQVISPARCIVALLGFAMLATVFLAVRLVSSSPSKMVAHTVKSRVGRAARDIAVVAYVMECYAQVQALYQTAVLISMPIVYLMRKLQGDC